MTNTATVNTSNKNTNTCGKHLMIKTKLLLFKTSEHTNSAKQVTCKSEFERERERERGREREIALSLTQIMLYFA